MLSTIGLMILTVWLLMTNGGRTSLAKSPARRNRMTFVEPFVPLFIWFGGVITAVSLTTIIFAGLDDYQAAIVNNLWLLVIGIVVIVLIFALSPKYFARGLKGMGLNIKTMLRDFLSAFVHLIAIYPLILSSLLLTLFFGQLLIGPSYQITAHQELELLTKYPDIGLRVLIAVIAIVIAPLLEELMFRGLLQTMLRSYLKNAWISIVLTSVFFSAVHGNVGHWLALFVLAVCLGYSYEKSGSLLRPIFIHALFNAINVTGVLLQ